MAIAGWETGRYWPTGATALCLCLGVILLVGGAPERSVAGERETVRITNGQWPPYLGPEEPHYGLASRIVTAAFERAGYDVEYGFFPWSRSLHLAREGAWDGTAVWMPSADRERDFYLSDTVIVTEYVFFHRKDLDFDWKNIDDLAGYHVGITSDYAYGEVFDQAVSEGLIETEEVPRDELNLRKLLWERIDLFPIDIVVGARMIAREFDEEEAKQLTWHPRPVRSDHLHLMLSREVPGNKQRMEAFNEALAELRREGRIEAFIVEALGRNVPLDSVTP